MPLDITSKSIDGIADLVVMAPIKQGFIDAFENITYETRLRLTAKTFHDLRVAAREYELIEPFTDVVKRIQSLRAFRIGILDMPPRRHLILAATFGGALEPYMRLIWDPLGPFLDLLFCNCEAYVSATDHHFAQYLAWVRAHQVDVSIFNATTPLTVGDELYLENLERLQRKGGTDGDDAAMAAMTGDDPDVKSKSVRDKAFGYSIPLDERLRQEAVTMGTEALVALYRLTDYYPPDRPQGDGKYLLRAAKDLLAGWDTKVEEQLPKRDVRLTHAKMFEWLERPLPPGRDPPAEPTDPTDFPRADVQAGVLSPYPAEVNHGALLLLGVADAERARVFIDRLLNLVSWDGAEKPRGPRGEFINIAVTKRGLENLGVPAAVIARFPKEFREGMDDRAGLIGDVHANHPRRWPLPQRFKPEPEPTSPLAQGAVPDIRPPVEMSEIDLVVQLRIADADWGYIPLPNDEAELAKSKHPLKDMVLDLLTEARGCGLRLLSIEPMRRMRAQPPDDAKTIDHFGFVDQVSQPKWRGDKPAAERDGVALGELLLGYRNDRGDPKFIDDPSESDPSLAFLRNGSFLAIRKLRQNVRAWRTFLKTPDVVNPPGAPALTGDELAARVVGRRPDGKALIPAPSPPADPNDYDFSGDLKAQQCPFQAHIRRANPRLTGASAPFQRPTPRIMRRGMSYGPEFIDQPADDQRRGVMFIAYGASLAEQFEVIQRWLNGGNPTGVAAAQNDPLTGVHPPGDARRPAGEPKIFRFPYNKGVARVTIPEPFVSVEWGLYAFAPSRKALESIAHCDPTPATIGDSDRGEAIIRALRALEALSETEARSAWKVHLEDFTAKDPAERADTPDIWAAIRKNHGGTLRIPGWVLVAGKDQVDEVFVDSHRRYSVAGEAPRMVRSTGEIYVGFDPGARYVRESGPTNAAIWAVNREDAFEVARKEATLMLQGIFEVAKILNGAHPGADYPIEIDLGDDFITWVLARVCTRWFGLPDLYPPLPAPLPPPPPPPVAPGFVEAGGWHWMPATGRTPRCPGDFLAASRYCFYPDPTEAIAAYGIVQGSALRSAAMRYVAALRAASQGGPVKSALTGPLTKAMCDAYPGDDDQVARNLIGIMTGALPPLDGNLRSVLYEWIKEKTLWRHQQALLDHYRHSPGSLTLFEWAAKNIEPAMAAAMQRRPAPDLLWRTALKPHRLGEVDIKPGDRLILSVVAATHEQHGREQGTPASPTRDVHSIFGGLRKTPATSIGQPVHACPAYEMAMGTMLGILTALLEVGRIEALPGALVVRLTPP